MFGFFKRARRARTVAVSIGQLIHMLSAGRENHGEKSPERVLRGLGVKLSDSKISGEVRMVEVLVPMTVDTSLPVSLFIGSNGLQMITIKGDEEYFGFSFSCNLPFGAPRICLDQGASRKVTTAARMLYAQCRSMPNVIEMKDFE
jgi:hypothetical protein